MRSTILDQYSARSFDRLFPASTQTEGLSSLQQGTDPAGRPLGFATEALLGDSSPEAETPIGMEQCDTVSGDPVLTIEDLASRFNVSTKTISRWRSHGLVAQRYDVGGRKRVGFLASTVEESALSSFDKSHVPTALVEVVTLTEDLHARSIRQVDFLKVDIEGFDLFALKGFDWAYAPRFVLYEFEDRKTTPLGYSLAESSAYMAGQGYRMVYSVWEPIVRYGSRHEWRGLFLTPPTDVAHCWGNVLCFRDETDFDGCMGKHLRKPWALVGRRGRN
jgi:FkbM family methyltransferase